MNNSVRPNRCALYLFMITLSAFALADETTKPDPQTKTSETSKTQAPICPHTTVKALVFKVENNSFRVSGQTKVKTVYATLAQTFPEYADNLALGLPTKPGWFHLTNRAKDESTAQDIFLCAFHKKFGEALKNGSTLSLIKRAATVAPVENPPSLVTQTSALQTLFDTLQITLPKPPEPDPSSGVFALTTEIELGKIAPLLSGAPAGIFVTIGGDRAFRGAALFTEITGLLIFDLDPRTVRFNQINAKLLKADNLEHYRRLRWEAPLSEWKVVDNSLTADDLTFWRRQVIRSDADSSILALSERLNRFQSDIVSNRFMSLSEDLAKGKTLSSKDKIWHDTISTKYACAKLHLANPQQDFPNAATYIRFRQGNYLFDEVLFQRLRNLALNNKIFSVGAQLGDTAAQDAIFSAFKNTDVGISVLDFDNGYLPSYIGTEPYARLIKGFMRFGVKESRLIAMANLRTENSRYADHQACSHSHYNAYLGFTFDFLSRTPKIFEGSTMINTFTKNKAVFNQNNWQDIKLFR